MLIFSTFCKFYISLPGRIISVSTNMNKITQYLVILDIKLLRFNSVYKYTWQTVDTDDLRNAESAIGVLRCLTGVLRPALTSGPLGY